ncbi:MAG TPA: DUF4124 domain-containing protein [Burkholderiales bacterium]|nr:DUF4124 domain-containing protein [Burkholderiales bacterium]
MLRFVPLALCILALPASAEMYKWTDENGSVHYSDQPPPPNVRKSEALKTHTLAHHSTSGEKPAAAQKSAAELEMEFRKRRLETAEAEAKAQKEAKAEGEKKENCKRATGQVSAMQNGGRVTRYGPNGEQVFLTDDEIAKAVAEAKKAADSWCH